MNKAKNHVLQQITLARAATPSKESAAPRQVWPQRLSAPQRFAHNPPAGNPPRKIVQPHLRSQTGQRANPSPTVRPAPRGHSIAPPQLRSRFATLTRMWAKSDVDKPHKDVDRSTTPLAQASRMRYVASVNISDLLATKGAARELEFGVNTTTTHPHKM